LVGDIGNRALLEQAIEGADAVIHTAALHSPHVGLVADAEFQRINEDCTRLLIEVAAASGVPRFVFTSTTALYGEAVEEGSCTWIDEGTTPKPKTVYHRTKLAAERALERAASAQMCVRIIRMSRCFPEPADVTAVYRLHRGVDLRDVADAHLLALSNDGPPFQRFIISGATPFNPVDVGDLATRASALITEREPLLASIFRQREWKLPSSIDRVYSPRSAQQSLKWEPKFGFEEVAAQLDRRSIEVLPAGTSVTARPE
jgi:nucleoside-diphosphate-sugar epimerase